ncbi:hypothetical protein GH733_011027 [Mirounga leonina]|nr:hypothetical protein GH733_011027 [Mirounga leonina]
MPARGHVWGAKLLDAGIASPLGGCWAARARSEGVGGSYPYASPRMLQPESAWVSEEGTPLAYGLTGHRPHRLYRGHTFYRACVRRLDTPAHGQRWVPAHGAARAHPHPAEGCMLDLDLATLLAVKAEGELSRVEPPVPPEAALPSLSSRPGSVPPRAPSPNSPSPGAAGASAGTPPAAPRSECCLLPLAAGERLPTACPYLGTSNCSTASPEQPGGGAPCGLPYTDAPRPQPKFGGCAPGALRLCEKRVTSCSSWPGFLGLKLA